MSDPTQKPPPSSGIGAKLGLNEMKEFMREYEVDRIHKEFLGRMVTLIIAAFGLVTALAWDDTLRSIFRAIFGDRDSLPKKFGYSILITLLAVIVSVVLARMFLNEKDNDPN